MTKVTCYYLIHIQFLGFRFSGWAKQPGVKTIHLMLDKTIRFVLGHEDFKTLGSSRTDAKVSANQALFELFVSEPLDMEAFLHEFNLNLPQDIRALKIEQVGPEFNIIRSPKIKEYLYFFAGGAKGHPFSAPFLASFPEQLDLDLMREAAPIFEGEHDFRKYCTKPKPGTQTRREVLFSRIEPNLILQANFFPAESWAFRVRAKGFLRNQVRHMMGQLLELGRGKITLDQFRESVENPNQETFNSIAPAAGLMLNSIELE
ncbi:MAG: tRNA pseudouridine(38-40) synthase TruA [Bacteroidia bacterium]|nr:tRNA pseudouridine(38-40) synthase TruA [Bacteroidia bacterium]